MQNINSFEGVLQKVQEIFRDVFEDNDIVIQYDTTSIDIPEWDSLNHIALVISIEKQFKIQFTANEIQTFKNVGQMCDDIFKKLNK